MTPILSRLLAPLMLVLLLLAGGAGTELLVRAADKASQAAAARRTESVLASLKSRIEARLNGTLFLASGIEAQIRADDGVLRGPSLLRSLAILKEGSSTIRNIGVAPANRIAYIHPLKGNEKALGLYYPDNPQQWPAIERVIQSRKPFLAGPVKLVQGGEGLIYRVPVFLDGGSYWGLISTVIDVDALWQAAGLSDALRSQMQIRGKDASGKEGAPVMGAPLQEEGPRFGVEISVPGGSWYLESGALVVQEDSGARPWIRGVGWLVTLLLVGALLLLMRHAARLRQLNEELARARDAAQAADRAKSAFLATMSHEIRTPMNGVLGMTELLQRSPLSEGQADQARIIRESAESLRSLLDDILDFAKIDAGQMSCEFIEFDLPELLEGLVGLFSARATAKGLRLDALIAPALYGRHVGDPTRIRQIISNLLSNAVKFTDAGSVLIEAGRAESGALQISVRDSGIGMDPAALDSLFTPFMQADSSHTRRFGGTGLGLSISQRLAQIMGGEISVASEPGKGSCFILRLPWSPALGEVSLPTTLKDISVLLASADPLTLAAISPWLEAAGARLLPLADWAAVIRSLDPLDTEITPGRVLILDHELPEAGRILDRLLASSQRPACKWLSLLSDAGPALPHEAQHHGLNRPLRMKLLLQRVLMQLHERPAQVLARHSAVSAPRFSGQRILLVEDNIINRKVAQAMLEVLGVQVALAGDGLEAVEALAQARYALVLMDMQMPGMDGIEATRVIRDPASAVLQHDVCIVALTANAYAEHLEACLAAGMQDLLPKPIDSAQLVAMLEKHLPRA